MAASAVVVPLLRSAVVRSGGSNSGRTYYTIVGQFPLDRRNFRGVRSLGRLHISPLYYNASLPMGLSTATRLASCGVLDTLSDYMEITLRVCRQTLLEFIRKNARIIGRNLSGN